MNKEVIKRYKDVFDYWLAGGLIWVKITGANFSLRPWKLIENPMFEEHAVYIQDDKYSDLRKAQADGKVIKYRYTQAERHKWYKADVNDFTSAYECDREYRIKPDEPTFKAGDWVRNIKYKTDAWSNGLFKADKEWAEERPEGNTVKTGNDRDFELWKPQPNEWCWFWDTKYPIKDEARLMRFKSMGKDNGPNRYVTSQHEPFEHCEPFMGTLPTHLKD